MGVEDDALVEGGDDKRGCCFSLAWTPALVCLCCCFVLFGAASDFFFEVAGAVFFFCGKAFVFPGFDLVTGANGAEERDVNNVQFVLTMADHVATFDELGLAFFFV